MLGGKSMFFTHALEFGVRDQEDAQRNMHYLDGD